MKHFDEIKRNEWHSRGRQFDPDQLHKKNEDLGDFPKSFFLSIATKTPLTAAELHPGGTDE